MKKIKSKFPSYKNLFLFLIILGGFLFFSGEAMAADYYVDSFVTDTNPASSTPDFTTYNPTTFATTGGSDSVFKTVADINAFSALQPGDNIYFRRGQTWNEQLTIPASGSKDNPITFDAFGNGDKPIIDGENARAKCIYINNYDYITIKNIHIKNATDKNFQAEGTTDGIIFDNGISTGGASGFFINAGEKSSITNSTIYQGSSYGIALYSGINTNFTITGNTFIGVAGSSHTTAFFLRYADKINFSNNTIDNWSTANIFDALIDFISINGAIISNNTITNCGGNNITFEKECLDISGTNNTIVNSEGIGFLFVDNTEATFSNLTISGGKREGVRVGGTSAVVINNSSVYSSNRHDGNEVHGFVQTSSAILTCNKCVAHDMEGDGFNANNTGAITCNKCLSYNNGITTHQSSGDGYTAHDDSIFNIYNSMAYGNMKSGVAMTGNSSGEIKNCSFFNNYESALGSGWDSAGDIGIGINASGTWNIKNNITQGHPVEMMISSSAVTLGANITSNYNDFYNSLGGLAFDYNGTLYNFLNYKIASSTLDLNSLNQNPIFTDTSVNDFTLTYLSPAIDAGTDVGLTTDYAGNPIYGTPDIGAYEYQPPYSMGTDKIDVAANVRVYGDGKFRNVDVPSGITADFSINPVSDDISQYLDVDISIWDTSNSHEKEWTETSTTITGNTIHTVGDLEAGKYYNVTVDNAVTGLSSANCDLVDSNFVCQANFNGQIFFTWTGGYSTHTFNVTEGDNINPVITNNTIAKFHTDTASVTLSLTTSESSTCKYSTENTTYDNMTNFTTTGETSHSTEVSNLSPGKYTYYAICRDDVGNDISYTLSFEIAAEEDETDINNAKLKKNNDSRKFNDDKKIYYNQKKPYLKGEDPIISNGTVKIYKEGKKIATVDVNENGKWSKKISFGHNKTYTLKIKFYDKYGTLKDTKKYDVNIDTKNPVFSNPFPNSKSITRNDKVIFTAVDEDSGVAFYKVKLLDKNGHVTRNWRNQDEDWYKIPKAIKNGTYILICRVYDKAGNYTQGQTTINIKDSQNSVQITGNQENDLVQTKSNQQIVNPKTCFYTVQQGDTLWSISKQIYGDATQYKRIADLNPDLNIDTLKIGQKLKFCNSNNAQQNSQDDSNSQNYNQQIQNQIQAQPEIKNQNQSETKSVHWWNPFSWF